MQKIDSVVSNSDFKANQIVRLESTNTRLYAEVIQVIPDRQLCWVRPLILAIDCGDEFDWQETATVVDLRMSSDLLWPIHLFKPALDTEVISLLTHLEELDFTKLDENKARASLHDFIRGFWRSRQE